VEEIVDRGVKREEMTVHVEVKNGESRDGLQAQLEKRLREDLGVSVPVKLVDQDSLREIANIGKEGKPRRLLDRRAKYQRTK